MPTCARYDVNEWYIPVADGGGYQRASVAKVSDLVQGEQNSRLAAASYCQRELDSRLLQLGPIPHIRMSVTN